MLIYLGTFAVSVGIAAYGEHLRTKKNNEKGFYLCLALAVLVMAVLAGLRDPSVGTDSVVYEEWVADAKLQDGLLACIRQRHKTEPLFMTLVYLAAHVFGDVHWLYFMVDLLACGLFMIGLVQYKEYVSVPYGWLAYLCLYYGDTYNAERSLWRWAWHFWRSALRGRKSITGLSYCWRSPACSTMPPLSRLVRC